MRREGALAIWGILRFFSTATEHDFKALACSDLPSPVDDLLLQTRSIIYLREARGIYVYMGGIVCPLEKSVFLEYVH